MKALVPLLVSLLTFGCTTFLDERPVAPPSGEGGRQAIASQAAITGEGSVRGGQGKVYRFFQTDDQGAQAATRQARRDEEVAAANEDDVQLTSSNTFKGSARAQAKTTVAHARLERFKSLGALLDSLQTDKEMLSYEPRITRDTPRVREEVRNVAVCAFIFATKKKPITTTTSSLAMVVVAL